MKTINKVILSPADRNCSGSRCINKVEVLSRNTSGRQLNRAFTLVELLVVVLIIGILSAIAIPMYQGAVDKSHWSTMLPGAKAIKDAEEAVRMSNGLYTANMENLDVRMPNGDVQYTLETVNDDGTANVVRATSTKLPTVRLSNYLDENVNFAGQLHCEAKDGDERATRLCEKLLAGQYIMPVDGGYTAYLLDQELDKDTCDHAEQSWSTSQTKCYRDDTTRCTALEMNVVSQGQCGFTDEQGKKIGAEGECIGHGQYGCRNSQVENGGKCVGMGSQPGGYGACSGSTIKSGGVCEAREATSCRSLTIEAGGTCIYKTSQYQEPGCSHSRVQGTVICNGPSSCGSSSTYDGGICVGNNSQNCLMSTFKNGAICYANVNGACKRYGDYIPENTYQDTSCCCGTYCPDSAPKCAASRCDPYYMDPNNFKNL